ncbi:hypothetical protein [Sphingomonas oryzagri]
MRTQRIEAAKSVATCLFAAEEAIDIAVSRLAELNVAMPLARLNANVSAIIGQSAIESSTNALSFLAKAREQIVATHMHLKVAGDQMGLQAVSFGDSVKPESAELLAPAPQLRIAS